MDSRGVRGSACRPGHLAQPDEPPGSVGTAANGSGHGGRAPARDGGGGLGDLLHPLRAASKSMRPLAAEGTPDGSWRPIHLMAACSAWMPTGRPSPERASAWPASASGSRCARPTSSSWPTSPPESRVRAGRRDPVRPRPELQPAGRRRARLQLPRRRPARHALRHQPRRSGEHAHRRARRERSWATSSGATARSPRRAASRAAIVARAPARNRSTTGSQLADIVARAAPRSSSAGAGASIRPRASSRRCGSAVNRELETLPIALAAAVDLLRADGRLAVISYHSLEDRIVKRFIAAERRGCVCPPEVPVCVCGRQPRLAPVGPQPRRPNDAEVALNPRSRSAVLRTARRFAA